MRQEEDFVATETGIDTQGKQFDQQQFREAVGCRTLMRMWTHKVGCDLDVMLARSLCEWRFERMQMFFSFGNIADGQPRQAEMRLDLLFPVVELSMPSSDVVKQRRLNPHARLFRGTLMDGTFVIIAVT